MSTLTSSIKLNVVASLANSLDIGQAAYTFNKTYSKSFTDGTGALQANEVWSDQRTLSASSTEDLDLSGDLTNALGVTVAFTSIKGLIVSASSDNTNDVIIGGASSAQFYTMFGSATDTVILPPGSFFALCNPNANGYAVTATTADLLKIANSSSGTSVTYDIIFIGETA